MFAQFVDMTEIYVLGGAAAVGLVLLGAFFTFLVKKASK